MESAKEAGSNLAASAKCGIEKTKATIQEKGVTMTSHNPVKKEIAREKKEVKHGLAEANKQQTQVKNAAVKHAHHITGP